MSAHADPVNNGVVSRVTLMSEHGSSYNHHCDGIIKSTAVDGAMKLVCLEPVISTLEVFVYKISVTNRPCLTETQPRKFKCCSRCVAFVHI